MLISSVAVDTFLGPGWTRSARKAAKGTRLLPPPLALHEGAGGQGEAGGFTFWCIALVTMLIRIMLVQPHFNPQLKPMFIHSFFSKVYVCLPACPRMMLHEHCTLKRRDRGRYCRLSCCVMCMFSDSCCSYFTFAYLSSLSLMSFVLLLC